MSRFYAAVEEPTPLLRALGSASLKTVVHARRTSMSHRSMGSSIARWAPEVN